jgi:hypothetical protein
MRGWLSESRDLVRERANSEMSNLELLLIRFVNNWIYDSALQAKQSSSWEANSRSPSQEIFHISWNPKIHYHSQEPAAGPYDQPHESSPHCHTLFPF